MAHPSGKGRGVEVNRRYKPQMRQKYIYQKKITHGVCHVVANYRQIEMVNVWRKSTRFEEGKNKFGLHLSYLKGL